MIKSGVRQPNKEQTGRPEKEKGRESSETTWEADSRPKGSQCLPEAVGREH